MYLASTGNVGIGTVTPVGGLAVMNGNVGVGTWVPGSALNVVGNVGIGTTIPPNVLYVNGTMEANGFKLNGQNASGTILVSNAVGIGTWMAASTLPSAALTATAVNDVAYFNTLSSLNGSNNFQFNGTNVGIGTFSNINALQITGNVGIGTFSAPSAGSNGLVTFGNVGIGTSYIGATGEGALTVMNGNVGIGTWTPSGALVVIGNVGIGTATAPAYNLDLVNNTARERIYRRQTAVNAPASPVAINSDTTDLYVITGLGNALTINITAGTPNNGDLLEIRIKDSGTARALTWGTSGASITSPTTVILPATTVISTVLRVLLEYNSTSAAWECIAVT